MELKYSYNEFLAFLLIYLSWVDLDFADEEKDMIKKLVGKPTFDRIYTDFMEMSDYAAYETILSYKGLYYPTVDKKQELIEKMKDLFYVDADFNIMERELLNFLQKMM